MPPCHDEQLLALIVEARQEHRRVPLPHPLSVGHGVGLHSVLHRVVDDADVHGRAGERASHAHGLVESLVSHRLEQVHIAKVALDHRSQIGSIEVSGGKDVLVLIAVDGALDGARELLHKVGTVGTPHYLCVGVLPQAPCREAPAHNLAVVRGYVVPAYQVYPALHLYAVAPFQPRLPLYRHYAPTPRLHQSDCPLSRHLSREVHCWIERQLVAYLSPLYA